MLICLDQRNDSGCRAKNRDSAKVCQQCGKSLRFALKLHNRGTIIGSYRIANVIGYGGFGAVYEAEDTRKPGVRVALKETFDPASVRAFQDEFAVLHRLHHDHLPRYYEMFEAQGNGYLIMELIPGQSLLDVLEKCQGQPLIEAQVMGYAIQACDALTYLHSQNPVLIHRDIKPDNIRLTPDGLIKVVDFGLIKQGMDSTRSSRRALTPAYAALEQWGGTGIHTSPQSDMYSLGATLYHLLTGQTPYTATDRIATNVDPLRAPRDHNPRISAHVSDALMRAMALQAHNRFTDAATFKHALMVAGSVPTPVAPTVTVAVQPPTPAPTPAPPPPPVHPRINPLFPVTVAEWRDDIAQHNTVFGSPAGYWCYVRPGNYAIGGWEPNDAVETIALPGFWIGKYPITVQQYRQFMHAGGYTNEHLWTPNGWKWHTSRNRTQPWEWDDAKYNSNNQPVIGVTWYEAAAFAAWINTELSGSLPSGHRIRLPTEAEWEAAAAYDGHGKRRTYPWGEQKPSSAHVDNKNLVGNKAAAAPVGGRPAGAAACGAHDMVGTVWEWTASEWKNAYPAGSGTVGKDYTTSDWVSVRGASWYHETHVLLCAARGRSYPSTTSSSKAFAWFCPLSLRTNVLYSVF